MTLAELLGSFLEGVHARGVRGYERADQLNVAPLGVADARLPYCSFALRAATTSSGFRPWTADASLMLSACEAGQPMQPMPCS